jgi:hypothetical protein
VSAGRRDASVLGLALTLLIMPAGAAQASRGASLAPVNGTASTASAGMTAPSGPPLTSPLDDGGAEDTAGVPSLEGDQLVENGLSSPLCDGARASELSNTARSNCQTSGFVGAPAPTNNYDLDVNIGTGTLGIGNGQLLSVIQDVFIAPVWEGLVWLVQALVVMLQWCYTLELLGGSMTSGLRDSLREAQTSFTEPWLALVLTAASVLALYNGLIRRRVAETLGQALLTVAMMAVGLWLIADPMGTVGAVGQFANQASLGTLGAVAQGTTANAPGTLGDSMRALFSGAIEVPWCYLEFGDVRWCSDPAMLEPRLRKAASSILASEQAKLDCRPSLTHPLCHSSGRGSPALELTSELLRKADTNGALFLAFPANGPERNSTKNGGSLLHVLCQSENDSKCEGATMAQAEFRSDGGTFPRMLGVLLIAIGVLGMAMLFGLVAIHLLVSALFSLFLLLLAPFIVLAPALGDAGRAVFGGWLTRLLGAVCSKLIFSFVLGALLTTQRMLASLHQLGWWTQWLLISTFWWFAFLKRREALEFVRSGGRTPVGSTRQTLGQRIRGARQVKQDLAHPVRWAKDKLLSPLPEDEELDRPGLRRPGPGKPEPGLADRGQQEAGGTQRQTGEGQQSKGHSDEQPREAQVPGQSEGGDVAERLGRDGEQTARTTEGTAAAEPRVAVPREQAGSEVAVGAGSSRQNRAEAEKPPRLERVARVAAYASDPEADEAAWLANARRQPVPAQPPGQQQPPTHRLRSSTRAATESTGSPPTRTASDPGAPSSQSTPMRTSHEIMDDAREVAAGRKRQLGLESLAEEELEP